jgi:anti-sigma factor RsiW
MIPVQPEELSALIDGELDPQRAAEVEIQIAADRELRVTIETLRNFDDRCRASARTVAFVPQVRLPAPARRNGWFVALAVAIALVGARTAVRMIDTTTIAYAFQVLVLAAVLAGIVWLERKDARRGINPAIQSSDS